MTRLIFSILILLFLTACLEDTKVKRQSKSLLSHNLVSQDSILKFSIPDDLKQRGRMLQLFNENKMYFLDTRNNLIKFDIDQPKSFTKIKIAQRGPNGFGPVRGFKVISEDSILIIPTFISEIGIVNASGEKVGKIEFDRDDLYGGTDCSITKQIYQKGNDLFMPLALQGNWSIKSVEEFKKFRTTLRYNTKSHETKLMGMSIPFDEDKLLLKKYYWCSSSFFDNKFIISFNGSHDLFVTEDFATFDTLFCPSEHVSEFEKIKISAPLEKSLYERLTSDSYEHLIKDPYREVLYRFYRLGNPNIKKNENLMELNRIPPRFGIMVFDKNLDLICDQIFPDNKYNYKNVFVGPEGLYISTHHDMNPDYDLDHLCFELFKLEGK